MSDFFSSRDQQPPKSGLHLLNILVLALFCLFAMRFWYLQVHKGEQFADRAKDNQLRREQVYAPRGVIRDADGELLAVNEPAYALGLVREECMNLEETMSKVSQWTGVGRGRLWDTYNRNKKKVKSFEPMILVPELSFDQLAIVEAGRLRTPGLRIVIRSRRKYKHGVLFAHILGYVSETTEEDLQQDASLSMGDFVGKQGLESHLERRLRGIKGMRQFEVDASGRKLTERMLKQPKTGEDLTLSIHLGLQQTAAEMLKDQAGAVVVMNPDTGELLALVSSPSYDSNSFGTLSPKEWDAIRNDPMHPLQNRAIQGQYPPGSVFKLVVAACGLSQGLLDPKEKVLCEGGMSLGKHYFRCWNSFGHGSVDFARGLTESCDVYFYKLGLKLGVDRISEFSKNAGFGSLTGITLPHEKPGLIPSRAWKKKRNGQDWSSGETLNMSIGQGYTLVTPLQVARYIAALLNGGRMLRPNLIAGQAPEVQRNLPVDDKVRKQILNTMIATVDSPAGTARRLRRSDVTVGAKTGTAQVVRLTAAYRGKDTEEIPYKYRDHAWMAGFGEQGEKRYVVVAMVEHGGHGSSAAGPVVKGVLSYLFSDNFPGEKKTEANP